MAKYTTQLKTLIESGVDIFDFDYPFFDETKRAEFEQGFIDHFYFNEIGAETPGRFKHYLKVKFRELMPYYNEIFKNALLEYDVVNNYDLTETLIRETTGEASTTNTLTQTGTSEGRAKVIGSDTPSGTLDADNIDADLYASQASISNDSNESTGESTGEGTSTSAGNENYTLHRIGNIGIDTASDMLQKHIKAQAILKKGYKNFYDECANLFMLLF